MRVQKVRNGDVASSDPPGFIILDFWYFVIVGVPAGLTNQGECTEKLCITQTAVEEFSQIIYVGADEEPFLT